MVGDDSHGRRSVVWRRPPSLDECYGLLCHPTINFYAGEHGLSSFGVQGLVCSLENIDQRLPGELLDDRSDEPPHS